MRDEDVLVGEGGVGVWEGDGHCLWWFSWRSRCVKKDGSLVVVIDMSVS